MLKSQIQGQLSLFENKKEIPMMPEEYKGKLIKSRKNLARYWTPQEIEWVEMMYNKGYSRREIAISIGRDVTNVYYAINMIRKRNNIYNDKHVDEKYSINNAFLEILKPKSVLDPFCGVGNFYVGKVKNVTSNDIISEFNADYHMDAFKLLCHLYYQDKKYDLVDLDSFGNTYECYDLAIKMAKKGLIITIGEKKNCKRFKRNKFTENYYNLSLENYNTENIIKHIQKIGERNKKYLIPVFIKDWKDASRIWFKIETFKARKYRERKAKQLNISN